MTRSLTQKLKETQELKKAKKGFTLIELIVVIAIIGVLAAMLVPSMIGYVNESKISKNDANARTIYSAAQAAFASFIDEETVTGTMSSTEHAQHEYIEKVDKLLGDIDGDYTINVKQGEGVESVTYVIKGGTATSESSPSTGHYPTKKTAEAE